MEKLNETLNRIFQILAMSKNLDLDGCPAKVEKTRLMTAVGDASELLSNRKSKLNDQLIDLNLLKNLLVYLDKNGLIVRLNHVGFGYRVDSQQEEKQRLIRLVKKTDQHLYEEESNDFALWLFLGNVSQREKPLIEFVPVEKDHPEIDYFLPHIQFDIDTKLNADEIEETVKRVCHNLIQPYRIVVIDGITYVVRNRLGVVDGVNIFLDLATRSRNVEYHRKNILKRIS